MPKKTFLVLIAVALHDARFDLAADTAARPDRTAGPQFRTDDPASLAHVTGSLEPAERVHDGPLVDQHRPAARIGENERFDGRALRNNELLGRTFHRKVRRRQP